MINPKLENHRSRDDSKKIIRNEEENRKTGGSS